MRKQNKYHNIKSSYDGYNFDSLAEVKHYKNLVVLKCAGAICNFRVHPKYPLLNTLKTNNQTYRKKAYIADFEVVYQDGTVEAWDIKGGQETITSTFRLKAHLFCLKYPHINLIIKY